MKTSINRSRSRSLRSARPLSPSRSRKTRPTAVPSPSIRPPTESRRLRVALLTFGSRGDVEPYVGLGVALARAGHHVTVAAPAAFEGLVRRAGLESFRIEPDPRLHTVDGEAPRWLGTSTVDGAVRLWGGGRGRSLLPGIYSGCLEAARGADVIVYSLWLGPAARMIAQARGKLAIPGYLAPIHPTRAFGSPYLPDLPLRSWNLTTHRLALWLGQAALGGTPRVWRSQAFGLERGTGGLLPTDADACLYGFSRWLVPPAPDWPRRAVVTGPWWLEAPQGWQPPQELKQFLQGPGRVVFLGFGSMIDPDPGQLNNLVAGALERSDCRAVLLAGPRGQLDLPRSPGLLVVRDVPFGWLFPRVDAIIHHGGAGTTAQAARAGKPSFAIPFFAEQAFWGRRLHEVGAGPPPLPRGRLTSDQLALGIKQALVEPKYAEQAARLGSRVRSEQGLARAVRLIEAGWLERRSPTTSEGSA